MKNSKIKIETGSEKLTQEEINSNKDFNKLHKTYTTTHTSTFKTPGKFGTLTKVVVVTTVVVSTVGAWKYWSSHKSATQGPVTTQTANSNKTANANSNTAQAQTRKPYIHPPIKGVNVPYSTYSVDAGKGGTVAFNHSKIEIPASAFCDENGKEVTGKVDIKYREFRNAVDFFASGIPMTYDSAGQQYTFESAGMLDIQGYQNGKKVYIKNGKSIQVSMLTTRRSITYNIYELDTTKQNWNYLSQSKAQPIASKALSKKDTTAAVAIPVAEQKQVNQLQNTVTTTKQQVAAVEKTKPVEPKKVTSARNTFNIDADPKDYPELAVYKNLLWEPDANDKNYKPSYAGITWDDASLKRSADGANYTFTVRKGAEQHSFIVHPVFEGNDYVAAKQEFDKKYTVYQAVYNKRLDDEKKAEEAYQAMLARIKKEQEDAIQHNHIMGEVTNLFSINNFGIYNTDWPENLPSGAEVIPHYTDIQNDNLNNNDFYLVEKDKNAVYDYHPGHNCRFNPKAENFAWMVTNDNRLAIYSLEDFQKMGVTSGNFTFILKVMERPITSFEELKAAFKPYLGDLDKQWGGSVNI